MWGRRTTGYFAAGIALLATATSNAQYASNFEPPVYTGSAGGTVLTGQDGWQLPAGVDFNVYTYAGNTLGFPLNPRGGLQFIGGAASTDFARAQHNKGFAASLISITWDTAVRPWAGADPLLAVDNIASVSLQPSGGAGVRGGTQSLQVWQDVNNPGLGWKNLYQQHDAAGVPNATFQSLGAAWENLAFDRWYRNNILIDIGSGAFVSATITDLATNVSTTANPVGWFLNGGANNVEGLPLASAIRFFAGGGAVPPTPGNIVGFDNLNIFKVPGPGALALLGAGLVFGARRRRSA